MRLSYADQLIELDRQRRNIVYGRETKRFHLKIIAAISGVLYATLYVMAWLYPRGVTHVWIDDVLVEVLEDSMIEQVGGVSGCIFVASLVLLLCMSFLKESSDKDRHGKKHRSPFAGACGPYRKAPGLSVPFSPATVQSTTTAGATEVLTEPIGVKGHHDLEGEYAIRTRAELDKFLSAKELPKRMEGSLPTAHNSVNAAGTVSGSMATAPAAATSISAPLAAGGGFGSVSSEGIRVQYGSGGERASAAASADRPAETMWNSLGIVDPERSQVKVRKWLSDLCQTLVEEVDSTNRWFVERQLRHFDCGHSLDETIVMPPPSSAPRVGFGVPAQPVSSPPSVRKMDALMDERNKIATQGQNVQNIDVTMHIDQRLQLEMKLDTTATFTPSSPASVAEQQARRTYVVGRIRTFASQKSLASYHHNCGDISTWRDDFPTDAHLLTHILRTCVPGFTNYVRFPHQPLNAQQHLALVVGDTGEPYFYVRYRTGAVDKTYPTQPGPNSLFEALLLFSAVARTHHGGSYGGIWGVMDLSRSGLLDVL